jgi:hypothetical protein
MAPVAPTPTPDSTPAPPAATKRTTPRKATNGHKPDVDVVDLDERFHLQPIKKYPTKLFGQTWNLVQPNVAVIRDLEAADNLGSVIELLGQFFLEAEREEFYSALRDITVDKRFSLEDIQPLSEALAERVFSTPS